MLKRFICFAIAFIMAFATIPAAIAAETINVEARGITEIPSEKYSAYTGVEPETSTYGGKTFIARHNAESLTYTINVADGEEENYRIKAIAGCTSDVKVGVWLDGAKVYDGVCVSTGSYTKFSEFDFGEIYLKPGKHTLKVDFNKGIHYVGLELDVYKEEFRSGSYKKHVLPTIIQAEDFDMDLDSFKSADGKNNGSVYRLNEGIDIYKEGNGYYIGISDEEFTTYTFDVEHEGAYTILGAAPTTGDINIFFDNYPYPLESRIIGTEAETILGSVYLTEGEHSIRITGREIKRTINVDYIRFRTQSEGESISLNTLNFKNEIEEEIKEEKEHPIYKEYYVSAKGSDNNDGTKEKPFATIDRAAKELEKITANMTGDIIVNIAPGEYSLNNTIKLGNSHGGKNGYDVIFRGEDKDNLSLISGGKKITGWQKHNDVIYKAPLDYDGIVRNFYVNEFAAVRARSKYPYVSGDFYNDPTNEYENDGFYVTKKNFPVNFARPADLELVWYATWACQRTAVKDFVKDYDEDHHLFIMDQPYFYISTIPQAGTPCAIEPNKMFFIENAMELLDEPGEFYYNRDEKMMYYYPVKGEDLETADTYIAEKEFFLNVEGSAINDKVENISFENIAFKYGAWKEPSTTGTFTIQASSKRKMELTPEGKTQGTTFPFQIMVKNAKNVNFRNCEFACMESDALIMKDAVTDSEIVGCIFRDMSSGAITIGMTNHGRENALYQMCENIKIENNVFRRVGTEYPDSIPITVFYERKIDVLHNDIADVPYSGISIGWGWGANDPAGWGYNKISYNHVADTMRTLDDGAHIYSLGRMRETEISYNYFSPSEHGVRALYTDTGAEYIALHHNVTETNTPNYLWWYNGYLNKEKLYVYENYSTGKASYSNGAEGSIATVESHHKIENGNWPKEALEIKQNAGLEPQYKYLLAKAEPSVDRPTRSDGFPRKPYRSATKPYVVQAEDYIRGENGVAFNDTEDSPKLALSWDLMDGEMIHTTIGGEWVTYDLELDRDGEFYIDVLAGHGHKDGSYSGCHIYIDGKKVIDNCEIPPGPNWSCVYITRMNSEPITLSKGKHTVKYEWIGVGHYLDYIEFVDANAPVREAINGNEPEFDEGVIVY